MRGLLLGLVVCAGTAQADVVVTFQDGAPKDRFEVTNTGACNTAPMTVIFDLAGSPSGLIFDISAQGAGVEVFQPIEIVAGAEFVTAISEVNDGDNVLTLTLDTLPEGQSVTFTTDLDDTVGTREIAVSGAEIEGARASMTFQGMNMLQTISRPFDNTGTARMDVDFCVS